MARASTTTTPRAATYVDPRVAEIKKMRSEHRRELRALLRADGERRARRGSAYQSQPGAMAAANGQASGQARGSGRLRAIAAVPQSRTWQAANRHKLRVTERPYAGMADAFLTSQTHKALRDEARQCARRFSLAQALLGRMTDLVVGDGFIITHGSTDRQFAEAAQALLDAELSAPTLRGPGHSWTRVLRRMVRAMGTDGDHGLIDTTLGKFEEIQSERIVNPGGIWIPDTSQLMGGVETDEFGAPIAYHIQSRAAALTSYVGTSEMRRVAARDMYFLTSPLLEDSGQTRGVPFLTPAIPLIELLESYIEDQALAAKIATYFGLIMKTASGQSPVSEIDQDDTSAGTGEPSTEIKLGPGYTATIKNDESIEQLKPEYPVQSARDFATLIGMHASASMGLPLILTMLDPSDVNFHGFKSATSVAYRGLFNIQAELVDVTRWACRRILGNAMHDGRLRFVPDWDALSITPPPMPTPDFGADVKATVEAINNNLMTRELGTQLLGTGTAQAIAAKRAEEVAYDVAHGITPRVPGMTDTNPPAASTSNSANSAGNSQSKK